MRTAIGLVMTAPLAVIGFLYFALAQHFDFLPGGIVAGLVLVGLPALAWWLSDFVTAKDA